MPRYAAFPSVALLPVTALLAAGTAPRVELSWAYAQSMAQKIAALEQRAQPTARPLPTETMTVTEGELNSYLNLSLGPKMPKGVSALDVRFDRERIAVRGMVDLEEVKGQVPAQGRFSPMSLLGGRVPVEIKGRLRDDGGFGTLEFEDIRLGPMPIPVSLLQQMVASWTRTSENPQGFDIRAPFRLPYALKHIRLQPGQALLDF